MMKPDEPFSDEHSCEGQLHHHKEPVPPSCCRALVIHFKSQENRIGDQQDYLRITGNAKQKQQSSQLECEVPQLAR